MIYAPDIAGRWSAFVPSQITRVTAVTSCVRVLMSTGWIITFTDEQYARLRRIYNCVLPEAR